MRTRACAGEAIVEGCTNEAACNYDMDANVDDGTCLVIGESCDDMDDMVNDIVTDDAHVWEKRLLRGAPTPMRALRHGCQHR